MLTEIEKTALILALIFDLEYEEVLETVMSTKKNATLVEIREEDGAQRYRFGPRLNDIVWLCGSDRAQKVELGDKGELVYSSAWHRTGWTFHAYDKST